MSGPIGSPISVSNGILQVTEKSREISHRLDKNTKKEVVFVWLREAEKSGLGTKLYKTLITVCIPDILIYSIVKVNKSS